GRGLQRQQAQLGEQGGRIEAGAAAAQAGRQEPQRQQRHEGAGPARQDDACGPAEETGVDGHGMSRRKWVVNVNVVGTAPPSRRAGLNRSSRAAARAESSKAMSPLPRPTVTERTRPVASSETTSKTSASTPAARRASG